MKKIDALLKKVEVFEKLAVYGDRKSFLKTLAQELPRVVVPNAGPPGSGGHWSDPNSLAPDVAPSPDRDDSILMQKHLNAPAAPEKAAPGRAPAQFDPRVKAVQSLINRQLVPAGIISPIDEDGKWGTETASALKQWGDKNQLSGVPLTAVFTAAQSRASVQPTLDALNPGPNAGAVASK